MCKIYLNYAFILQMLLKYKYFKISIIFQPTLLK
jgi:hypothetical protein